MWGWEKGETVQALTFCLLFCVEFQYMTEGVIYLQIYVLSLLDEYRIIPTVFCNAHRKFQGGTAIVEK